MSIEKNIDRVATALERIAAVLEADAGKSGATAPVNPAPSASAAPVAPTAPAPSQAPVSNVTAPAPQATSVPPANSTPAMPAAPDFVSQAQPAAPAASGAPFSDAQGMVSYVMEAYKALGAEKGARIQQVLTGLGYTNINDVKPEHYGQLHQQIEQLKVS